MPKVFYTENDIVDMVKRGELSLVVNDDVVLTDLAYEKANRLGLKLLRDNPDKPPAAPVRPYISQPPAPRLPQSQPPAWPELQPDAYHHAATPPPVEASLQQRIRSAVLARMGGQVDSALLDTIIQRVLASLGMK